MYVWIFDGFLGSGKTFGVSVFSHLYAQAAGCPIFSNYGLRGSQAINNYEAFYDVAQYRQSIMAFDEFQNDADARMAMSNTNIHLTQLLIYLRKIGAYMMTTSPDAENIDARIRRLCNIRVFCEKSKKGFCFNIMDFQRNTLFKRKFMPAWRAEEIFKAGLYNTYRIIRPIPYPTSKAAYGSFLDKLIEIREEAIEHFYDIPKASNTNPPEGAGSQAQKSITKSRKKKIEDLPLLKPKPSIEEVLL